MMDIVGVLGRFLKSSRFPKVSKLDYSGSGSRTGMIEGHKPFELTYHKTPGLDKGTGTITIRSHARDSGMAHAWAKRLNVPYAGQSLGPFTNIVLDQLLRTRQRRYLSDGEKTRSCRGNGSNATTVETLWGATLHTTTQFRSTT